MAEEFVESYAMAFLFISPRCTPASTEPTFEPWIVDEYETFHKMRIGRGYASTRRKYARVPIRPSHDLTWGRTQTQWDTDD
jgi:hypothetical protein